MQLIIDSSLTSQWAGNNGTIDGQGQIWWDKFHANELNYTRGYLLEIMYSENILVSNVTFVNSSSWNLHPVYCKYGPNILNHY